MNDYYKQSIRPILDCFDRIRVHLLETGVKIPCICSVGCQSAGKSSVLESITGIQLPRGEGTVTRCPIMIQLRKANRVESARIKYETDEIEAWKDIKIEDISKQISKYQELLLEKEGNPVLSETAIQLEVKKLNVSDLTLYDLPGITHIDEETFEKIKNIIIKFLENKETIALFVHASTSDFDSNECLSLIRKISKNGQNDIFQRTIPIFSKPDDALKTNPGTLVNNLKLAKQLEFEFDPILVLNRNQEQIKNNVDIEKIRKLEDQMLKNPLIKDYCSTGHGINALVELLVKIQREKLLQSVPEIKQTVKEKLKEYSNELAKYPKGCRNRKEFNKYLLQYCDKYDNIMKNKLNYVKHFLKDKKEEEKKEEKKEEDQKEEKKEEDNCLETRIRNEFNEFKKNFTEQIYKYLSSDFYDKVKLIYKDSIRLKPENFYGEDCWDNIIHEEIKYIFNDCEGLIDKINEEIKKEIEEPFKEAFNINIKFYNKANEIKDNLIDDNKNNCLEYFRKIKEIECDRNFTNNERYIDYSNKIQNKIEEIFTEKKNENNNEINDNFFYFYTNLKKELFEEFVKKLKEKDKEKYDLQNIKIMSSIYSYMKIFLDRFLDYLYNGIMFYLLKSFLHSNFTKHLKYQFADMDDKTVTNIMGGDLETLKKIEKTEKKLADLTDAYKELINL